MHTHRDIITRHRAAFTQAFGPGPEPRAFFAPGRVNIIGEHIDYLGGSVFPAAIGLGVYALVRPRADALIRCRSVAYADEVVIDPARPLAPDPATPWGNFPRGVVKHFTAAGYRLAGGCDVLYASTLPEGAGLSSSAAIEVLTAYLLFHDAVTTPQERVALATLCQTVENQFVGVQCGIMDQFAVAMGRRDHALLLDTATLEYRHVPLALGDHRLVIMNSNKARTLASSRYNERRAECARALETVRGANPAVTALALAAPGDLAVIADPVLAKRARHAVTEQARVRESVSILERGDLETFGIYLVESHRSLQHDYEVSGPELDALVDAALEVDGCLGARMTGAGFGGCAIALVHHETLASFREHVGLRYNEATNLTADFYDTLIDDGVQEVPA